MLLLLGELSSARLYYSRVTAAVWLFLCALYSPRLDVIPFYIYYTPQHCIESSRVDVRRSGPEPIKSAAPL